MPGYLHIAVQEYPNGEEIKIFVLSWVYALPLFRTKLIYNFLLINLTPNGNFIQNISQRAFS